jgi:adenylate kinase
VQQIERGIMRILLVGPPGAGKGTQAVKIAEKLGIPHISTGDIFRSQIAAGTELGKQAQEYMNAGQLVPSSVTNGMVAARLAEVDTANGFLLDGYPRNLDQIDALDAVLVPADRQLEVVLELTADTDVVVKRLLQRAVEQGRADDTEDVIRKRLEVYADETAPIVSVYADRGILVQVDGIGTVEEVNQRINDALGI